MVNNLKIKISKAMKELMQNNCICNYVIVQNGNETYIENIHALDAYMKTYEISKDGNAECYIASLGKNNKAAHPVFSITNGMIMLNGQIII